MNLPGNVFFLFGLLTLLLYSPPFRDVDFYDSTGHGKGKRITLYVWIPCMFCVNTTNKE